jgi:hypothetical protein
MAPEAAALRALQVFMFDAHLVEHLADWAAQKLPSSAEGP